MWHHNARVNSHQRWKQMRNRVCFHLWCELTSTMNVMEWQVSWNSCYIRLVIHAFTSDSKMKQIVSGIRMHWLVCLQLQYQDCLRYNIRVNSGPIWIDWSMKDIWKWLTDYLSLFTALFGGTKSVILIVFLMLLPFHYTGRARKICPCICFVYVNSYC